MDDEKKKRLEEAGFKVGDADEFLADIAKPKRLQELEDAYAPNKVEFDDGFAGEWMVTIEGYFGGDELKEISDALEEANRSE